ncbi:hypothetical protein [Marinobacter zhejiangensis]|uniref:Uncharacterized protein n=1 Tax=Marinobacter zhejiangensis TaxID=488535 RepID=A0A1I4NHP5_9GAMM|nr:hypothetical protein [Marinobacter zhejiangensis]SFM14989.1 hypothetical protein SAMN04487963_1407 [Marinobacter zhejiangensis]
MEFLCRIHRGELAGLPQNKKMDLWLSWMAEAGNYADRGEWVQVIRYAGCAFDLSSNSVSEGDPVMAVEMVLAAICLAEAFRSAGHPSVSEVVVERALKRLGRKAPNELRSALREEGSRQRFFADYMGWPALRPSAGCRHATNTVH